MLRQILSLSTLVVLVAGHGRVIEPPSRSSMWRVGYPVTPNYDDDGLNCGGYWHQYFVTGGKCGICGDPYDMTQPRNHELGGKWGSGLIVAHYDQGQVITVTVVLTAYHKGFWEFKICNDPSNNNQECFDQRLLQLEDGGTKYYPTKEGTYSINYRLPTDLACDHCVIQWRYTAGNNWAVCEDGTEGLGCGNQENFVACSDISIGPVDETPQAPVEPEESDPSPIPLCVTGGILELIRIMSIRPRPTPTRHMPVLFQRKNHRMKRRNKKFKPRKRKKKIWNYAYNSGKLY